MAKMPGGSVNATQPLIALRQALIEARSAKRIEEIQRALINAIDGLISHVEKQARDIEALRSDLSHKQGIVSKIDGNDYGAAVQPPGAPANDEGDA